MIPVETMIYTHMFFFNLQTLKLILTRIKIRFHKQFIIRLRSSTVSRDNRAQLLARVNTPVLSPETRNDCVCSTAPVRRSDHVQRASERVQVRRPVLLHVQVPDGGV